MDITEQKLAEEALASVGRKLIEAHEQERTWIGRELHDDINQRLALLAVQLDRCREQPSSGVNFREMIQVAQQQISQIAKDLQSLSHRLHSSKLDYLGLASAANSFCQELARQSDVEISFKHSNIPRSLPTEISLCMFRVLQEALQNALKHSGVRHFEVELSCNNGTLNLTVSDKGIGFLEEETLASKGIGLISMRERLQMVGGQFAISTRPGEGTTVRASVPAQADVLTYRMAS